MKANKFSTILAAMLHDIGKVAHRAHDGRNHSTSGYDFLKEEVKLEDPRVLTAVRLHHAKDLREARLDSRDIAYIVYIADNIAAGADRRLNEDTDQVGFVKETPLYSVFNILNGNRGQKKYRPQSLKALDRVNMPTDDEVEYDAHFYQWVLGAIRDQLSLLDRSVNYLNSYLQVLENYLSYVPSSTSQKEHIDISLYDHVKVTTAFASCIYDYFEEKPDADFREALFINQGAFYEIDAFILFRADFSGIQSFLYKIIKENALKNLRSRSFYLDILLEVFLDEILDRLELSRANILYEGGGNAYLILPNTEKAIEVINATKQSMKEWLVDLYGADLYLSCAFVPASTNDFKNTERGRYATLFNQLAAQLKKDKLQRYTAEEIIALNSGGQAEAERECKICYRTDFLNEDNVCRYCDQIQRASNVIMDKNFFVVMDQEIGLDSACLPLPFEKKLYFMDKEEALEANLFDEDHIRTYAKNIPHAGNKISTRLWIADYAISKYVEELNSERTIQRIGVLRADVDNLGKAMTQGFSQDLQTVSRTATLSRNLSMFFKYEVKKILEHPSFFIKEDRERKVIVIYSGGDDVFAIGGWDDILGFAVDLRNSLKAYTQDTLTLSAGIGLYKAHYPIFNMAQETGRLEEAAKEYIYDRDGKTFEKNAVAVFDGKFVFDWDSFEKGVLGEKSEAIKSLLVTLNEMGDPKKRSGFLYHLAGLLVDMDRADQINLARLAYAFGKREPRGDQRPIYNDLVQRIYEWTRNKEDRLELITALYIYIYSIRGDEIDN